jgi:predicted dehydrogenase
MSDKRVIRWGILGTGRIASDFTTVLRSTSGSNFLFVFVFSFLLSITKKNLTNKSPKPDGEVVAVGSRTKDAAEKFANHFKIPHAYGNYEDLTKDPNVEIVYISSLHNQHYSNVLLALNNGELNNWKKDKCISSFVR